MGFLVVLIIQGLVFGFFCSYIAREKNRDGTSWFWLGFFFSILAVFALIAVPKIERSEAFISSTSLNLNDVGKKPIKVNAFEGERNVASSAYQLYLVKRFNIEKNSTLEKYVIGSDVFDTLEDSLQEANNRYESELPQIIQREKLDKISQDANAMLERDKKYIEEQKAILRDFNDQ